MNSLHSQILSLLHDIDSDFIPPLSQKINIEDYANKLIDNAVIIPIVSSGVVKAFIALYCNDAVQLKAYLSIIVVHSEYRKKGIAKLLIGTAIQYLKGINYKSFRLEVYKNNTAAISMYRQLNFTEVEQTETSIYMEIDV